MIELVNVAAFAFAPGIDGMWRHHEVFDGTYDIDDLLDAHEIIEVKHENGRRFNEWKELQQEVNP